MTTLANAPPLGLYSIGIREISVPALLDAAATCSAGFLHLRGGPRGYDLPQRTDAELRGWRRHADHAGVPITMVTADTELSDLFSERSTVVAAARCDLDHVARAATLLGASMVRILATRPPSVPPRCLARVPGLSPSLRIVIELHHPGWFAPAADTMHRKGVGTGGCALLLDSAQVHAAAIGYDVSQVWDLMRLAGVVHLSDTGHGLAGEGHDVTIRAARAAMLRGQPLQVGFEWTGAERTEDQCLRRFGIARARWRAAWRREEGDNR